MCDFVDMDGKILRPYDKIEFWSGSHKDWIKATVVKTESTWISEYDKFNDIWRPVHKTSMTVQPDITKTGPYGTYYAGGSPQKLRKSENIRKV